MLSIILASGRVTAAELPNPEGRLQMADGHSVMVAIDDYDGESRMTSLF
jgi:hypothetical protein